MRLSRLTGSIVLTTGLSLAALGGVAAAEDTPAPPTPDRTARICANADRIESGIERRIERIEQHLAKLAQLRERAANAGRDEFVARIDNAIAKANERLANAQGRLAQFGDWVVANCPS
jgi:hypothetical protein